jgi:catalase
MKTHLFFKPIMAIGLAAGTASIVSAQDATTELKSTPGQLVDALHSAFGDHHSRAVHAKGIILEGTFTPDVKASSITKAVHLQSMASKVTVRFSDFTGIPDIPDNAGPANPRGMAIKFTMPDGTTTDLVSHSFNGFPTANSDEFRELLLAIGASGPNATKPTPLDNFLGSHPIAKTFLSSQKTPASYATISYFGVNTFKFINKDNKACFIRYQILPEESELLLTPEQTAAADVNYLMTEIKDRIKAKHIKFKLIAEIAEQDDKIENPSRAWPASRKKVLLGMIELNQLSANTVQQDKALFFIPNNVPAGIETADPMLNFRSRAYPISVKERQ